MAIYRRRTWKVLYASPDLHSPVRKCHILSRLLLNKQA